MTELLMNINATAPVLTRDEILIHAPLDVVWNTQAGNADLHDAREQ
jgi:hypothetical protein